ncbi:MAG: Gx transporter family protein [Clostridiales bacterium]|nr:Gx transporter family protein [Clostridiales bacterium]
MNQKREKKENRGTMGARRVARYGLLVALAMVLSYVETLIPAFFAVPGMKLGLTNLVVMIALYRMGSRDAIILNLLRIVLVSMTFGNAFSLLYSLAGGLLSGAVMLLLKRTGRFGMMAVSVAGGIAHNVGQILMAMVLLETRQVGYYLLVLWWSGLAAGLVIGLVSYEITKRLPESLFR